jgi:hypothetical protein
MNFHISKGIVTRQQVNANRHPSDMKAPGPKIGDCSRFSGHKDLIEEANGEKQA